MESKNITIIGLAVILVLFVIVATIRVASFKKDLATKESELTTCQSELLEQESDSKDSSIQYRNCEESLFNCRHGVK